MWTKFPWEFIMRLSLFLEQLWHENNTELGNKSPVFRACKVEKSLLDSSGAKRQHYCEG